MKKQFKKYHYNQKNKKYYCLKDEIKDLRLQQNQGFFKKQKLSSCQIVLIREFYENVSSKKFQHKNQTSRIILECLSLLQLPFLQELIKLICQDQLLLKTGKQIILDRIEQKSIQILSYENNKQRKQAIIKNDKQFIINRFYKGEINYLLISTIQKASLFSISNQNQFKIQQMNFYQGQLITNLEYFKNSMFIIDSNKLYITKNYGTNNRIEQIKLRGLLFKQIITTKNILIALTTNFYLVYLNQNGKILKKFRTGIYINSIFYFGEDSSYIYLIILTDQKYKLICIPHKGKSMAKIYSLENFNFKILKTYNYTNICFIQTQTINKKQIIIYVSKLNGNKLTTYELLKTQSKNISKSICQLLKKQQNIYQYSYP